MSVSRKCNVCDEILIGDEEHTDESCRIWQRMNLSMKPLLGVAVMEAVKLALIDSVVVPEEDGSEHYPDEDERREWIHDPHAIPREALATMDPAALAQNVSVRLLGGGGWYANGVYSGNATPHEVLDACLERPDQDSTAEAALDVAHSLTHAGVEHDISTDPEEIMRWAKGGHPDG